MPYPEVIDWDETSYEERRLLSKPVVTVKRRLNLSWDSVFLQAFGAKDRVSDGYSDNLAKGKIAPERAYKLFNWLSVQDKVLASNIEDQIIAFRENSSSEQALSWDHLINKGEFSNLDICKYDDPSFWKSFWKPRRTPYFGISFSRIHPIYHLSLKLREEFLFRINSPFEGHLTSFRSYKSKWYPNQLSRTETSLEIMEGRNVFPENENGKPDPIWEEANLGKHGFVFFVTRNEDLAKFCKPFFQIPDTPIPSKVLNEIAGKVVEHDANDRSIFRINLMVK